MSDENEVGLFEAIATQRAIRRFRTDPVPDDVVGAILEAATQAPSGGNGQPWQFLILRDPALKQQVGTLYDQAIAERYGAAARAPSSLGLPTPLAEAPLLILVCRRPLDPPIASSVPSLYASIYPAVQNLLLAARGHGVGGVLTTLVITKEAEVKALLGIPDDVEICALIPMGYPRGRFGPLQRRPWQDVTYVDQWGTPVTEGGRGSTGAG